MKVFCITAALWLTAAALLAEGGRNKGISPICRNGPSGASHKVDLSPFLAAEGENNMKAFPPAPQGMVRYVLNLPQKEDENACRVELIVGKTVRVDTVNHYVFAGKIETETIPGWGFSCYKVKELGPLAGTKMAPPPDAPLKDRFVTLGGEPSFLRYNSRLPVVVYVPEGAEVRYRVWTAGAEETVEKG
jgi:ecotin